jgi:hypothetical protein
MLNVHRPNRSAPSVVETPATRKHEAPDARTPGASESSGRVRNADRGDLTARADDYDADFGFLPGAGGGTNPDTRHCHASIVFPPS